MLVRGLVVGMRAWAQLRGGELEMGVVRFFACERRISPDCKKSVEKKGDKLTTTHE